MPTSDNLPVVNSLIVTVDGPAGTGKSTVSRVMAYKLGLPHLDTGAFYRAATLAVLSDDADPTDPGAVLGAVTNRQFDQVNGSTYLDGVDVSEEIRSDMVTQHVSAVSAHPAVRELLVAKQRDWVNDHSNQGVIEGRDIGSVVFPEAQVKIYLDAAPEVRAKRRALQSGEEFDEVLADINRRDQIDSSRATSPLSVPEGAVVFDTSDLSFDEVVEGLVELVRAKS